MADLIHDLRYCLRQARRAPGFFSIAVLMIALGLAATTQIFTLVDALLLRPLPVRDPQSLVQLFEQQPKRPADIFFSYPFYRQIAQHSTTLTDVVGQVDTPRALEWQGHSERVHAVGVTEDFFKSLGVAPTIGRGIGSGDSHVALLSFACWSRSFGRDSHIVGQTVRLQDHPYTVIGVAPEGFTGTTLDSSPDLWIPFANMVDFSRGPKPTVDNLITEIVARLRPGVTAARAQEETAAMWARFLQEDALKYPGNYQGLKKGRLEVRSLANGISGLRDQSKTSLWLLMAGTGLLLLMVCSNVGGLLLARVTARDRDTAVRVALGASRWRILRQWLVESLLLAVCGWVAGLALAYATFPALMRLMPPARGFGFDPAELRTLALHPAPDVRIAAFSLLALALTVLLCTLAPAWRAWRSDLNLA